MFYILNQPRVSLTYYINIIIIEVLLLDYHPLRSVSVIVLYKLARQIYVLCFEKKGTRRRRKEGRKEAAGYPYSPYSKGPLSSLRSSSKKHVFILSAQCGGRNDNNSRSFFGHRKAMI